MALQFAIEFGHVCVCVYVQKALAAHKFMYMQTTRCTEIEITANHPKRKTNSTQSTVRLQNMLYSHNVNSGTQT